MRVFVAVDISEEARQLAAERIKILRTEFSDLRVGWDKPEKLHLTLKFLGEISEEKLPQIIAATQNALNGIAPFHLAIESQGAFPPRGAPRVLWLGVKDKTQKLDEIQKRLETEFEQIGFERERRNFKPHLTVARLKEPSNSIRLTELHLKTEFPTIIFDVSEIAVYKSDLHPTGSVYTKLAKIGLTKEKA
jgi:2'-5' RNA ligase